MGKMKELFMQEREATRGMDNLPNDIDYDYACWQRKHSQPSELDDFFGQLAELRAMQADIYQSLKNKKNYGN